MAKGWHSEPGRHALAAKGLKTKQLFGRKDLYEKAKRAVALSRKDKLEHSFTADWDEGEPFKLVEGEANAFTNELPDEEREASFHIHPNHEYPSPSPFDVVNAERNEELWSAVANLDGQYIVFKPNNDTNEYKEFDALTWDAWLKFKGHDDNGGAHFTGDGEEKLQRAQKLLDDDIMSGRGKIVQILWRGVL
jgi:hypothetical protein